MASSGNGPIGQALVDFSLHNIFPEEDVSAHRVQVGDLAQALKALSAAKSKLESDIHRINEETAPDVNEWAANAKALDDDINRSRTWANDMVRRSEAPDVSGKTIQEAEARVDFLQRETAYNHQLDSALQSIKDVHQLLDEVEKAGNERRILDSLRLLEKSWVLLESIPVSSSCRVIKLLNMRSYELKSAVHEVFDRVWNTLVNVDTEVGVVGVHESRPDEKMTLSDAVIGLKAYKEVDQRMALFWHSLDSALIQPRTDFHNQSVPSIATKNEDLCLEGTADNSITSLFSDLKTALGYLSQRLPKELLLSLSNVMMPDLIPRIISTWLDSAVPPSLQEMDQFENVIEAVRGFCDSLTTLGYSNFGDLHEWVGAAPRVWLSKCRESALDSMRTKLVQGLGDPKEVERVETQKVSKVEGKGLAAAGAAGAGDDEGWDAWADDNEPTQGQDDGTDAWGWGEEEEGDKPQEASETAKVTSPDDDGGDAWGWGEEDAESKPPSAPEPANPTSPDDSGGDAWGWGDDDTTDEPTAAAAPATASAPKAAKSAQGDQTRELTLKEVYRISSMPDPVIALISAVLEDGALLVGTEGSPVASAAAGLFSLPTLVLAMFRAVSPHYYSHAKGGSMFLYNDATYLSEQLASFASDWKARQDLTPRAIAMLRLDNDIKTLRSFAARAYADEMSTQRTVLRDLLGGSQNLLQQDHGAGQPSAEAATALMEGLVDGATGYVREVANSWSDILARSAWYQAVGSLADTLASKLVGDVMDLPGIGQDEAQNISSLITRVEALDDLFLPPSSSQESAVPQTAQYATGWLRLKYLSEVLQSNLNEVLYLWKESELSLEFTADEVVDLVRLSFVDNSRTRDAIREIERTPMPRGV